MLNTGHATEWLGCISLRAGWQAWCQASRGVVFVGVKKQDCKWKRGYECPAGMAGCAVVLASCVHNILPTQ